MLHYIVGINRLKLRLLLTVIFRPANFSRIFFIFDSENSAFLRAKIQHCSIIFCINDALTGLNCFSTETASSNFYHVNLLSILLPFQTVSFFRLLKQPYLFVSCHQLSQSLELLFVFSLLVLQVYTLDLKIREFSF
jgi:hypothetical protein